MDLSPQINRNPAARHTADRSAGARLSVRATLCGAGIGQPGWLYAHRRDAPIIAEICQRLDGLPLAIELVAVRIDMFGLRSLANVLDGHFLLMSEGQRTDLPRQQNLLGTLDWSYRNLSDTEKTILCRLSVFPGDFTLDAVIAMAGGGGISVEQVYAGLLTLSTKSLVTTDVTGATPNHQHRLLHITRAFVCQKIAPVRRGQSHRPLARGVPVPLADAGGSRLGGNGTGRMAWNLRPLHR